MNQQDLERYLWGAATALRGTIDAGDYKQFIFPLLFFKRICDVYEEEFQKALKKLGRQPQVDIILMDIMMPEMDGYLATQQIRQIEKFKNLPIIALTAKAMNGDREKCIQCGASDYISKPVAIEQLLSLMRVWLYQ